MTAPQRTAQEMACPQQPVARVVRVTKDHEYVDVDGFAIRRKRDRRLEEAVVLDGQARRGTGASAGPLEATAPATANVQAAVAAISDARAEFATLSPRDRVLTLYSMALEQALPAHDEAFALQPVVSGLLGGVTQSLADGSVSVSSQHSGTQPLSQALRPKSLEERKAALRNDVRRLQDEERRWMALDDSISDASHMNDHDAASRRNPLSERNDQHTERPDADAALRLIKTQSLQKAMLQMEVLTGMLDTVEELRERAQHVTAHLERRYHDKALQKLPHVNSPANAIRQLTAPQGSLGS